MSQLTHLPPLTIQLPEDCNGTPAHEVTITGILANSELGTLEEELELIQSELIKAFSNIYDQNKVTLTTQEE